MPLSHAEHSSARGNHISGLTALSHTTTFFSLQMNNIEKTIKGKFCCVWSDGSATLRGIVGSEVRIDLLPSQAASAACCVRSDTAPSKTQQSVCDR